MTSIGPRSPVAFLVLACALAGHPAPAAAFSPPPAVTLRPVASGLSQPLFATHAGDASGRLFIVEKGGRIKVLRNGALLAAPFLDISSLVSTAGERGLLGLAFHPRYVSDNRFFVFYTRAADGALRISSFTANPLSDVADPGSEREIITVPHPGQSNHNGGALAFGPDGYLYAGVGDGGGSGDPLGNAQNLGVLLGKILRLDVSGASGYAIPSSNPFVGAPGARGEIWAYGLRNPWRFGFDRSTGDLLIGDVGEGAVEEVDFQPFGAPGGRNYGWKVFEGTSCFSPPSGCALANHVPPVLTYGHNASGGNSITGGYVYRGRKSRALRGYYLYGDFVSNRVWAAQREGPAWNTSVLVAPPSVLNGISSFGEDEAGELYVVSLVGGQVFAIDGPPPGPGVAHDANGDSRADLAFRHADGTIGLWLMNGTVAPAIAGIFAPGSGVAITATADFDGNGTADLLWQFAGGHAVSLMQGATITTTQGLLGAGTGWTPTAAADFNGDGKADILLRHADGTHVVLVMEGASIARAFAILPPGSGWTAERTGDFDGDGRADVLARNAAGAFATILVDGFGVKAAAQVLPAGTGYAATLVADFDGDGKSDILWQAPGGSQLLWLMDRITFKAVAELVPAGTGWTIPLAGDFNGDGRADLVLARADGTHGIWLMDGTAVVASGAILPAGSGWVAVAARDFDGDGRADLLIRHANGTYAIGLVDGTSMPTAFGVVGPGWTLSP